MQRTPTMPSPSPSRSSTGSKVLLPRWPFLALLVGIACCSQGGGTLGELQADTPTETVQIFLIEKDGGLLGGRGTGCGGHAVPVEVKLPRRMPALGGALEALLGKQGDAEDPRSGLYNALHASPLRISNLQRRGGELRVRLEGYLELGDACDGDRALAQLTETALQFPDVQAAFFYLGDTPLREALAGR